MRKIAGFNYKDEFDEEENNGGKTREELEDEELAEEGERTKREEYNRDKGV